MFCFEKCSVLFSQKNLELRFDEFDVHFDAFDDNKRLKTVNDISYLVPCIFPAMFHKPLFLQQSNGNLWSLFYINRML